MEFYLLCDQGQQGGVLNPTKNDQFQVFLAVGVLFPKLLGMITFNVPIPDKVKKIS